MKAQLRVTAKSPAAVPKKPSHRAAKPDAWAEWLEAIAAQGLEVSEVLDDYSATALSDAIWSSSQIDATTHLLETDPRTASDNAEPQSPQILTSLTLLEPVEAQPLEPTVSHAPPEIACIEEPEPALTPELNELETSEAIAESQPHSWFHSKAQANATDAPPDDPLEAAIAQSQAIDLPYKAVLESRLGQSLNHIEVYGGTPEICDALDQLDARAALYDQQILFAESNPDIETATHEVIHALQARSGPPSDEPDLLPVTALAEQEAHQLTQEIVRSLDSGEVSAIPWAPIAIHTTLHPSAIARLREAPPPTVGENPQPGEMLEATANRDDRTPAPVAPAPAREPAPSAAQAETESTLEDDGLAPPVSGELEEVPALEAPTPPEPGITEADVAAREADLAEAEAALAAATDVDEKVDAYATAPPTLKAQEQSILGADLDALAKSENASFQEDIPDFQVTLSGETEELPELQVEAPAAGDISLEEMPPEPAPDPDIPPTPDPVAYTANELILRSISRFTEGTSPQDRAGEIGETLDDVRTTDPEVETSPGEAPAIPLEGETDPERIANQLQEGRDQSIQARDEAQQAVINGPGPEQVQPLVVEEAVPLGKLVEPELTQPEPVPAIADFNQREMPPEVNTAFDLNNQETMQASMADAQAQVQQTTEERDHTRQEQLDTTQAEADRQTLEADQGQRDAVQDQRERIQDERQSTLEEQTQAVRDIEDQAETRRTDDRDAIDDRVRGDQEAIRSDYQQAERDADAKVNEGERDAEAERREAEREAENQSWWDRAVSFVQEAFAALTSAISAIFDAVRAAINTILDAVKAAAEALINLAADFIKNAIAAFGEFLKGLVDGLLGDLFPGLAAALNEFIDEAVQLAQQAVDAVAEALRNGINALVEGLRAGLNAVLDVMQAGLELASGLIQAALAGDWGAVIRLLLEAVLKVIGIEPETFYGFIGRAEETFQKILDDPGAVVGHLLDAVKQGIQQFADNFLPHLQTGIIGWLTGALGADIQIPTEFNLMGVLDLARQIMGLTLQFIRRIAVRLIGEENVERIESLFDYVQTLITGGWSALFEQITESLGNLRDMVLDQIKEFLVTRLVIAAITKLATMFNPVGAIVQLVLTAWNIYTFLRDNLQRMIQIVQSIVEGISNIVNGVIAPAATRIEETLANLLPIAISFLANLLGIGGIANRVRQIIDSVRDRIENAIVTFIQRIASRFTGRGRGAGATPAETPTEPATTSTTDSQIGERVPIPVAGQPARQLYITVNGQNPVVMMQSPSSSLESAQQSWAREINQLQSDAQKQQARSLLDQVSTKHQAVVQAGRTGLQNLRNNPNQAQQPSNRQQIVIQQRELAVVLSNVFSLFTSSGGESVKARALEEIRNRTRGQKFTSPDDLRTVLVSVHRKFSSEGLRSLSIDISSETTMEIEFSAAASEPERLSIRWAELFGEADTDAQQIFSVQPRNETNAAISLNGSRIGEVVRSGNGRHAEENLLDQYWESVLNMARQNAQNGQQNTIAVVINRAPCHNICTPKLVAVMNSVEPALRQSTRFILAPTGVYEPTERLSEEEIERQRQELAQLAQQLGRSATAVIRERLAQVRFTEDTTSFNDLGRLVSAGWDLRQLQASNRTTQAGTILAEAAHKLALEAGRIEVSS